MSSSRAAVALALVTLSGCHARAQGEVTTVDKTRAPAGHSPTGADSGRSQGGPVVVSIVVDQFPAWMFEERAPLLPRDGGFATMRRRGTVVRDLRMPHACSDTAPGHAMLYTGAPPRASGIFGNEVPGNGPGELESILNDEHTRLIGPDGQIDRAGASVGPLRVPTIADALRQAHPNAVIVSISRKDRGAIFGGGRTPDATLWFDKKTGTFVTSTAFASAYPSWALAAGRPVISTRTWELLDAGFVRRHASTPDAQDGEGDFLGLGITFPHPLARTSDPASAFVATPFADEAVVELGIRALQEARDPKEPLFLAMSLSAMDGIGHAFGPDSWESWDGLLRVDHMLLQIMRALDNTVGHEAYAMVLSSDHGVAGLPELVSHAPFRPWCGAGDRDRWNRPCEKGERILQETIESELEQTARTHVGPGRWIRGVADPYVFLSPQAKNLPSQEHARLVAALEKTLLAHRGIERVIQVRSVAKHCPPRSDESVDALVCRAVVPEASGDLYVVPRAGSFFDADYVPGKGASHGTPGLYDRAVPMIVVAPGRAKAGAVIQGPTDAGAFARTLAALLDVEPPPNTVDNVSLVEEAARP